MTATELWNRISAQFQATPIPGVPAEYVRSFLARYESLFIAALQKRFDALSLPSREEAVEPIEDNALAAIEAELFARGFVSEPPKHGATAVWMIRTRRQGIDIEVDAVRWGDDVQLTRRQGRDTTDEVTVFGSESLGETLDLWGIGREPPVSSLVSATQRDPGLEPRKETELDREPIVKRQPSDLEPIVPGVLYRVASSELQPLPPEESSQTDAPVAPAEAGPAAADTTSIPTHDGGLRGERLEPASVMKGDRVVTSIGAHGQVEKIAVWNISGSTQETQYRFDVRLDSGRIEGYQRDLYRELRPPARVIPDLTFDGVNFLSPAEAWKLLMGAYASIGNHLEKARSARKAETIAEWERGASEAQTRLLQRFPIFHGWRQQYPDVEIEGFIPHLYRIFELMSGAVPRWRRELDQLKHLPKDREWGDELVAGDGVLWNNAGSGEQVYGRIERIEGRQAWVAPRYGGASIRLPLYYLLLDGRTPLQVPTYSEPIYLVTLAASILPAQDRHFKRGPVAATVKRFLAHHGIDVRTQVPDGAGMSVIYLRAAPDTTWTLEETSFMENALGLSVYREREASFEPWRTQAEESTPYQDYAGKGAGIQIAAEHVPTFAPMLASALKESGHALNRLGTAWLIRGVQPASAPEQSASSEVNGGYPPVGSGESPVEGCREVEFTLPGHGRIRVVCGARGRRDVWHNIYVGHSRYGFNGSRWSKGMVPAGAVLNAVAENGITVFGGRRVYENAENIRYL